MTKVSSLVCTATAMLLTFGMALAEDGTQNQPSEPAVTNTAESPSTPPENSSTPKEATTDTAPAQDNAAKPQAEPECN